MKSVGTLNVLILMSRLEDRSQLWSLLKKDESIHICAIATDPRQAMEQIHRNRPDCLILALELPHISGLDFLKSVNQVRKIPAIAISSRSKDDPRLVAEALEWGAVKVFHRSEQGLAPLLPEIEKALMALKNRDPEMARTFPKQAPQISDHSLQLIAIGASTGGTEALRSILGALPTDLPPIVVVQHMAREFTGIFAGSLDDTTPFKVVEVSKFTILERGVVYIAQGGMHIVVRQHNQHLFVEPDDSPPVLQHKPSVDVLFHSVAQSLGASALGVLLSGMGADGADGMLAMHLSGATTLAQDRASCVVFGMPGEAEKRHAVTHMVSLAMMPTYIVQATKMYIQRT